ncbi:MAG TPA: hypothetical protein VIK35_05200 [Verrucomicrobiae bacterium]
MNIETSSLSEKTIAVAGPESGPSWFSDILVLVKLRVNIFVVAASFVGFALNASIRSDWFLLLQTMWAPAWSPEAPLPQIKLWSGGLTGTWSAHKIVRSRQGNLRIQFAFIERAVYIVIRYLTPNDGGEDSIRVKFNGNGATG